MIRCSLILVLLASAVSCVQYGSLSFVIDNTKSMEEDISKVREAVDGIMDIILNQPTSQIKDVVLVTFNDPQWLTHLYPTKTREQLKQSLKSIRVHGGGDCPEYSMSGILYALENSLQNSYLFVFTDAPPKDKKDVIAKVKRVAQSKGTQIIFVRTPGNDHCRTSIPESDFKPYYDIAASTFGQVFTCGSKKEVEDILRYVKVVISGGGYIGTRVEIPPFKRTEIPFNVDDQTEYVVVSVSGIEVSVDLIAGPTRTYEKITWIHNAKVMKIDNPAPGDYKVAVMGNSTTSVLIFGRTDFTFQYGFGQRVPESFDHGDVRKQPRKGKPFHLLVNVTDALNTVDIKSAEILTSDDQIVIKSLTLRRKSDNYYTTDPFVAPNTPFLIAIKGAGKNTKKEIIRIAKTPIETLPDDSSPFLSITGPSEVDYEGSLKLTCNVEGYPRPNIIWKNSARQKLTNSVRTRDIDRSHFTSEITLDHITEDSRYHCVAKNKFGDTNDNIYVRVKLPFIVDHQNTITKRIIEYGQPFIVRCNITSKYPIKIVWYYKQNNEYKEIVSSGKYSIVKEGVELRVVKGTQDEEGEYKCQAYLNQDKNKNVELVTTINTNGKPPTFLGPMQENITIRENNDLVLKCPLSGYPPPKISWLFKLESQDKPNDINQHKDTVVIQKTSIANAGKYTCVANNILGNKLKTINVNVQILPKVKLFTNNAQTSSITVDYGSKVTMVCEVTSHSKPTILWKNAQNEIIASSEIQKRDTSKFIAQLTIPKLINENTYTCEATNEIGKSTKQVRIQPKNPFQISNNKQDAIAFDYEKPGTIICPIKSNFAIIITWYRLRDPNASSREVITNSAKYTILKDGTKLRINKVEEGVEGKYVCEAAVKDDKSTFLQHVVDVSINQAAPVIDKTSEVLLVKEHQTIVLRCKVSGYPPPKISWLFKLESQDRPNDINQHKDTVVIQRTSIANAGKYTCVANNILGNKSKTINVNVQILPKVKLTTNNAQTSSITVDYGSKITMVCEVTSHSKPTILWKNAQSEIIASSEIQKRDTFKFIAEVTIPKLIKENTYTCEATNEIGKSTKLVRIQPKNPFQINNNKQNGIAFDSGKPGTIICPIKSNFAIIITWYRLRDPNSSNREVITKSEKYTILKDGTELRINNVEEGIEGKYVCEAAVKDDKTTSLQHVVDVSINQAAPFIDKPSEVLFVKEHQSIVLRCNVIRSYPKAKIMWQFKKIDDVNVQNLPETSEELRIVNTDLKNFGFYYCNAQNNKGIMKKEISLTVQISPRVTLKIDNKDVATTKVDYNSKLQLYCLVQSHVMPEIIWKNKNGNIIETSKTDALNKVEFISLIRVEDIRKSNTYTCEAVNDVSKTTKTVSVEVEDPFPDAVSDSTINIKYGEPATIKCGVKSKFPTKIAWSFINKQNKIETIQNSDKYSLSIDGAVLTINKMDEMLDGQYKCTVVLKDDESVQRIHSTNAKLDFEPPQIEVGKDTVHVRANTDFILKCITLKGNPRPKLAWTVEGENSNSKLLLIEYSEDKAELTIRNVRYEDSKLYKCVATSPIGDIEKTVKVIVEGPPIIISDDDKVYYGVQGDHSLQVPCDVKGHPTPTIKWMKDKTTITSGGRYIIKKGMLIIMKPEEDDTANYTCAAENKYGNADKSFVVSVSRNIEDGNFGNLTYVYMLKGETKDFKCKSQHSIGKWYQETWPANKTGTLTLKDVTTYDDGNYTCRISDEQESKSHTYVVDVGFPPRFIRGQNKDYITEYWQGENKNLDCNVEMKPDRRTVTIEWRVNGEISANNGYLHPVAGWGKYTCKVSNYHGEISKTFYVTSISCLFERSLLSRSTAPLVTDISSDWPAFTPKTSYISIEAGSKLFLSCQSQNDRPNNFKILPGKDTVTAICNKEDNFLIDGVTYKFSEIECNKEVEPTIKQTGEQCSPIKNTELIKVGFNVNNFLDVYEVCFNKESKTSLYSKATIRRPPSIYYNASTTWKKIDAFYNGIHEDINIDHCSLKTNQMINKLDVREGPAQLATYIAGLNTVSVWDCDRKVTWKKVEEETRSFLRRSRKLDTWTGADNYIQTDNNISYPKYLWKILKFTKQSVVAVVFVNDPTPKQEDILCKTSCKDYRLLLSGDPYTYCCSIEEFKEHFSMPDISK